MIAVAPISTAGIFPQTATDASSVAYDNGGNPGFVDLLTLLAGALQPQAAPTDGESSDDNGDGEAARLAPERDPSTELGDGLAADPSLLAALTMPFRPVYLASGDTAQATVSSDINPAQATIPAQTIDPLLPASLPVRESNAENAPNRATVPIDSEKVVAKAGGAPEVSPEATVAVFAFNVSPDAKTAGAATLPTHGTEFSLTDKSSPAHHRSAQDTITAEPMVVAPPKVSRDGGNAVQANLSAIVDDPSVAPKSLSPALGEVRRSAAAGQVSQSPSPDTEVPSLEAPAKPLTVASPAQFSLGDGDREALGGGGKFKPSEAIVELADSTQPRFAHVQTEANVSLLRQHENPASEIRPTLWRPVVERVAQEIKTRIQFGAHEAVIQLEPPELGKIKIDLRLDGAQIHARIVADDPATQALIDNHWADLRQALDSRQVDFVNMQFEPQAASGGGGQWSQGFNDTPAQGQERGAGANGDRAANVTVPPLPESGAVDQGRISMWA